MIAERFIKKQGITYAIFGDSGATSRDDAIFSGDRRAKVYFKG